MPANPKILLVDDEIPITANLAPFLERTGFQVIVASDGEQALQQIAESLPDLVVMDVLMPRLDGRKYCAVCAGRATGSPSFCLPRSESPWNAPWHSRKARMIT